jgi:hypothetical protein
VSALRIARPGQPARLIPEPDPWADLTPWQRRCVEAVYARNGNRTYAARDLGTDVTNLQCAIRRAKRTGIRIPDGARRGRDLRPRKRS